MDTALYCLYLISYRVLHQTASSVLHLLYPITSLASHITIILTSPLKLLKQQNEEAYSLIQDLLSSNGHYAGQGWTHVATSKGKGKGKGKDRDRDIVTVEKRFMPTGTFIRSSGKYASQIFKCLLIFRWLSLYTMVIIFPIEWCIEKPLSSSIITYTNNIIHNTIVLIFNIMI